MNEETHNVALFFGLTPEGGGTPENAVYAVAKATEAAVLHASKDITVLKTILERPLPTTQWAASGTQVIALLRKELSALSIPALLVKGWMKYDAFRKFCQDPEDPEPHVVPLFAHTISSTLRPIIELQLDGVHAGELRFEVELSVEFEDVSLVIQRSRFMAAKVGAARAKGTVKCEDTQIFEHEIAKIEWLREISFGDGYPIRPSRTADAATAVAG
jgi:hypothetical protein